MEKEDQLIKELIREGFLKSAPDDFTDNIMQAVVKTTETKKDSSIIIYVLVMVGSIFASAGIMAYYKPSIFQNTLAFFGNFLSQVYLSFSGLFSGSFNWGSGIEINSLILGTILIMAVLLVFDNLLSRKRKVMNVFV